MVEFINNSDPITIGELYRAFWEQEAAIVIAAITAPNARFLSLWIVLLAGLSEAVGQSVILFIHRVRPVRFLISLLLSALLFGLNFLLWVTTIWLLSLLLSINLTPWTMIRTIVAVSYLPLLLGFLTFLPYLGAPLNHLLYAISFIALVRILILVVNVSQMEALLCAAIGYGLVLFSRATIGKPFIWVEHRLRNFVAGSNLEMGFNDLLPNIADTLPPRK